MDGYPHNNFREQRKFLQHMGAMLIAKIDRAIDEIGSNRQEHQADQFLPNLVQCISSSNSSEVPITGAELYAERTKPPSIPACHYLNNVTGMGSIATWRAKRQCFMGRCGTTPLCSACPTCCSDSPQMVMEMPPPRSCCAAPRPSPSCCQAPAPSPLPPPVVSAVQCCRAAPAPMNPCCQALAPPQPPLDQEQCCLAAPSPNNICCRDMAPVQIQIIRAKGSYDA
ncbi:hypothetical protein TELCIR_15004 [Teladorsagia circumcincta]|uniref:Uncharacterized protein n=1 Tax=Teladorsagia circumcincta TaxID=45464 RepID=A0A2G9TZE6_TELCI|nr:hypothetical protein TELCIR_15004 [Teladorsagia circumcincta]